VPCSERVDVTWKTADSTATISGGTTSPIRPRCPSLPERLPERSRPGERGPDARGAGDVPGQSHESGNAGIADGQGSVRSSNDDGVTAVEDAALNEVSFAVQGGNPAAGGVSFRIGLPASAARRGFGLRHRGPPGCAAAQRSARGGVPQVAGAFATAPPVADRASYFVRFTTRDRTLIRKVRASPVSPDCPSTQICYNYVIRRTQE